MACSHVNIRLDQCTDLDWGFRIIHFDAEWGWDWSTYFAQAFGSVVAEMVSSPATSPIVRMQLAECSMASQVGVDASVATVSQDEKEPSMTCRRRVLSAESVSSDTMRNGMDMPPSKVPRTNRFGLEHCSVG